MSNKESNLIPTAARKLYFDIGNSAVKLSYRKEGNWIEPAVFGHQESLDLMEWLSDVRHHFEYFVVSSVLPDKTRAILQGWGEGKNLSLQTGQIPSSRLNYESKQTLGIDRFLVALGGWQLAGGPCVVIDAGTACTVDYMDADGVFQGGVILPGLSVLEKGIRQSAPALPAVERELPSKWPGKTTQQCLQWGIIGGFIDAVGGAVQRYEESETFKLYITGGDADLLSAHIDRPHGVSETLIFRGMEYFVEEVGVGSAWESD